MVFSIRRDHRGNEAHWRAKTECFVDDGENPRESWNILVVLIREGEQKVMGVVSTYGKASIGDHRPNMVIELLLLLLVGCEKSDSRCQYARCSLMALTIVQRKLCGVTRNETSYPLSGRQKYSQASRGA